MNGRGAVGDVWEEIRMDKWASEDMCSDTEGRRGDFRVVVDIRQVEGGRWEMEGASTLLK